MMQIARERSFETFDAGRPTVRSLDGEPATYRVEYELFARCGDEATTTTGRGRRGRGESSQSVDGG